MVTSVDLTVTLDADAARFHAGILARGSRADRQTQGLTRAARRGKDQAAHERQRRVHHGERGLAARTRVRVPVVGDVPAVAVDDPGGEMLGGGALERRRHVRHLFGGRVDAVPAPHHHRHVADLAVGDPADVVLVVPAREARGLAEVAAALDSPCRSSRGARAAQAARAARARRRARPIASMICGHVPTREVVAHALDHEQRRARDRGGGRARRRDEDQRIGVAVDDERRHLHRAERARAVCPRP